MSQEKICQWCFEDPAVIGNVCLACYDAACIEDGDDLNLDVFLSEEATEADVIKELQHALNSALTQREELEVKLEQVETETAKKIFDELDDIMFNNHTLDLDSDYPTPHYYEELKDDIEKLKNKYKKEN